MNMHEHQRKILQSLGRAAFGSSVFLTSQIPTFQRIPSTFLPCHVIRVTDAVPNQSSKLNFSRFSFDASASLSFAYLIMGGSIDKPGSGQAPGQVEGA